MKLALLANLWLHEPDTDTLAQAVVQLGLPLADLAELALAYTEVFLLNVYPYGTAFTDPDGELNGLEARRMAALYEAGHYNPPELKEVGAPDHLGLGLGFLARLPSDSAYLEDTGRLLLQWAPTCCLAVEREFSAHPFYRALAKLTRETLLSYESLLPSQPAPHQLPMTDYFQDEVSLRDIIRFFLAPACCGVYLSRSRLGQIAKELGRRLSFGSRFDVAELLFASAGEAEAVEALIAALASECDAWASQYRTWARQYPAWQPIAETWLARTACAAQVLAEMRQIVAAERI